MTTIEVHTAQTNNGKWVAATAASPYFCFEADSAEEVLAIARRAVAFYARHYAEIKTARAKREREAITPVFKEIHRELVCA